MMETVLERPPHGEAGEAAASSGVLPLDNGDVIEVSLLLSGRQMLALEEAAHGHGLTAGEMVRRLLQQFITGSMACKVGPA